MPPPPKPTGSPQTSGNPADEADRLGREHSNKREVKMRQERVRALADDAAPSPSAGSDSPLLGRSGPAGASPAPSTRTRPPTNAGGNGAGPTGVPGVPGAPVVQPRQSRVPDVDAGIPRHTPAAPRPAERADRGDRADRADRGADRADRGADRSADRGGDRAERAERPDRQDRGERPAERERPQQRVVEKPIAPPPPSPSPSVIDDVAVEAEELMREQGAIWARFSVADKISFLCALLTGFGTLLPWLWRKNEEVVLGLASGGVVHAVIAVAAIALLLARERPSVDERGLRPTPHQHKRRARRTALWMLLLALASTVAGTWFLLVYGAVRRFEVPTLEVGVGLYVTLAAGLGLSYSGFAWFWRGGRIDP